MTARKKKPAKEEPRQPDYVSEALGEEPAPEKSEEDSDDGVREQEGQGEEEAPEEVEKTGSLKDESAEADEQRARAAERERAERENAEAERTEEEAREDPEGVAQSVQEAARAAADREKALRDEVTQLRAKNRELRQQREMLQAPPPVVTPPAQDPAAMGVTLDRLEVQFGDDGKPFVDQAAINRLVEQRVAEATRPDPQQEFQRMLESERTAWVGTGEDAPRRSGAVGRVQQATEYLDLLTANYSMQTGQRPDSLGGWVDAIESSGLGDQFRTKFPEIQDMYGFVQTFFAPAHPRDRVRNMRRYMDLYVVNSGGGQSAAAGDPEPARAAVDTAGSNVVQLPNKPRSMAKRGSAAPVDTGARSRYDKLCEKLSMNPIGVSEEEYKEWETLDERFGAA